MTTPVWTLYPAAAFNRIQTEWDALNDAGSGSALLSSRFVTPCLRHFPASGAQLAIARRGDQVAAMTLLEPVGAGRWQTLQPSQAPLGFWLSAPGLDPTELLPSLARALPGLVLVISLTQQDPQILPRPVDSRTLQTLDYIATGRLEIPADFAHYWAERSKNVRQNCNKARNRLSKEGIEIRFECCDDGSQVQQWVADYGLIESAGWKQALGTSVHPDNSQGRFYHELLASFMPADGQVWRYWFNDTLVATDLCIQRDGVLYILKTTYAESWHRYSPAFLMHIDAIAHCAEQGIGRIEFYGPAMEWHRKLTADIRTLYHLNWYSTALVPLGLQLKNRTRGLLARSPSA